LAPFFCFAFQSHHSCGSATRLRGAGAATGASASSSGSVPSSEASHACAQRDALVDDRGEQLRLREALALVAAPHLVRCLDRIGIVARVSLAAGGCRDAPAIGCDDAQLEMSSSPSAGRPSGCLLS
jgi:hypothetical protein